MDIESFLDFTIIKVGKFSLDLSQILFFTLVMLLARAFLFLVKKLLKRQVVKKRFDQGKEYSIFQIIAYITYIIAISFGLENIGVNLNGLLVGSTALLVGLGLGLQDFFKDLVAGFIILWERTVTAGDIVEIAGNVGRVQEVGLRTTSIVSRDDIIVIIPNQSLMNERVINWSQNGKSTRFNVNVGVAYGSDTKLVEQILLDCALAHREVESKPGPLVHFTDFGDSSLDFSLFFYSHNLFRIERIKSELRFAIDQKFRENGVTIPFPQRDVWMRSSNTPSTDNAQ